MKLVYISHPFSGNEEANIADAKKIKMELQKAYPLFCFVNPLDLFSDYREMPYHEVLALDMALLERCDAIITCPGWGMSTGCQAEVAFAYLHGIERKTLADFPLREN